METLLAVVVFGLLIAFAVFGFMKSQQASRGRFDSTTAALVMTGGETRSKGASSPGRKTEDHATLSEVAEPTGAKAEKPAGTPGDKIESGPDKQRPQADRPLTSGDVGA
jgi:type II secretory pathway pseudopilin PulG